MCVCACVHVRLSVCVRMIDLCPIVVAFFSVADIELEEEVDEEEVIRQMRERRQKLMEDRRAMSAVIAPTATAMADESSEQVVIEESEKPAPAEENTAAVNSDDDDIVEVVDKVSYRCILVFPRGQYLVSECVILLLSLPPFILHV